MSIDSDRSLSRFDSIFKELDRRKGVAARENFIAIDRQIRAAVDLAKKKIHDEHKALQTQIAKFKNIKLYLDRFQDMRSLIKNESGEFELDDIRSECEDFLRNLPAEWGATLDDRLATFFREVTLLQSTSFSPHSTDVISLGAIVTEKLTFAKCPNGVGLRKAISRGRGRCLPDTEDSPRPFQNTVRSDKMDDQIAQAVQDLKNVQIDDYLYNSPSQSKDESLSDNTSQVTFSYCPSFPESKSSRREDDSDEFEIISELHVPAKPEPTPEQATKPKTKPEPKSKLEPTREPCLIKKHQCKRLSLTQLYSRERCLDARLILKIDDKFNKPMGLV